MTDIVNEIEGVISDIEAGVADRVSAGTLRRVAVEIERLRTGLHKINAYAQPYRDGQSGALDRIAVVADAALSASEGKDDG